MYWEWITREQAEQVCGSKANLEHLLQWMERRGDNHGEIAMLQEWGSVLFVDRDGNFAISGYAADGRDVSEPLAALKRGERGLIVVHQML